MATVLVIDDSVDTLTLLSRSLGDQGYRVHAADSSIEGLQMVEQLMPDVVLLDIMMPEMDGLEVCRRMKASPRLCHIPVIMLTAKSLNSDMVIGLDAGADDYITKPFEQPVVAARVRSAVRGKVAHDTLAAVNRRLQNEIQERSRAEMEIRQYADALEEINDALEVANLDFRSTSQIHEQVLRCSNVSGVTDALCGAMIEKFHATMSRIWLIRNDVVCTWCSQQAHCDGTPPCLHMISRSGNCPSFDSAFRQVPIGFAAIGQIAQSGQPAFSSDIASLFPYPCEQSCAQEPATWFAGIPMHHGDRALGVMGMFSHRQPPPHYPDALQLLARIGATAIAGIDQIERVQQASRAKTEFLANMSHELRTPMTAILGYSEILEQGVTDTEHVEAVGTIRRNGEHLLKLVNDILDLSRIESGHFDVQPAVCSPQQLVAEVVSLMDMRASEKRLALHYDVAQSVPGQVRTDPTRVRQILINLVSNAVKFTERGSVTVRVRFVTVPDESGRLHFEVCDTGIGMTTDEITRLFRPFSQADSSFSRKYGGSGLGLAISQRLTRLLGGEITVESEKRRGTTFTLVIPAEPHHHDRSAEGTSPGQHEAKAPAEVASATVDTHPDDATIETDRDMPSIDNDKATEPHSRVVCDAPEASRGPQSADAEEKPPLPHRILLVEDGPDNQRLISLILKKAGAEVTVAGNGQEAVDLVLNGDDALATGVADPNSEFDLILMDIQMPVLDGLEATRQLRVAGYHRPIVALTAHAMEHDRCACLAAGCDEYLTKPIVRPHLLATLTRVLAEHTSRLCCSVVADPASVLPPSTAGDSFSHDFSYSFDSESGLASGS